MEYRPYHLIIVEKPENWHGKYTFELYVDQQGQPLTTIQYEFDENQPDSIYAQAGRSPIATPTSAATTIFPGTPSPATPTPHPSETGQQALAYVADHYGIPEDRLQITGEEEQSFALLGRTFGLFTIIETNVTVAEFREYFVMIDLMTGEIEEDYNAIKAAETAAYFDRYGKLEPTLYDRLQTVSDETVLPVAVWVIGHPETRTIPEIYEQLAAEFPEAAEALRNGDKPMNVADEATAQAIQDRYNELRAADVEMRIEPVADWLRQEGYEPHLFEGMPSLTVELPKAVILRLEALETVAMIYLIEQDEVPQSVQTEPGIERQGQALAFEVIEQSDGGSTRYQDPKPALMVITSRAEAEAAKVFISETAWQRLTQTDFSTDFTLLIFWGWQYRLQEGRFQLEGIFRQADKLILVGADHGRPDKAYTDTENSPYHLIRVSRRGMDWGQSITFDLYFDLTQPPVASVSNSEVN